jgi:hypothetical protein
MAAQEDFEDKLRDLQSTCDPIIGKVYAQGASDEGEADEE